MHSSYLLRLQSELNEDLLQLLVHKVDTELLKAVSLQEENTISVGVRLSPQLNRPAVPHHLHDQHVILVGRL